MKSIVEADVVDEMFAGEKELWRISVDTGRKKVDEKCYETMSMARRREGEDSRREYIATIQQCVLVRISFKASFPIRSAV